MRYRVTYFYTDGVREAHEVEVDEIDDAIDAIQPDRVGEASLRAVVTTPLPAGPFAPYRLRKAEMCSKCGESHLCSGEFAELPIPTENRL